MRLSHVPAATMTFLSMLLTSATPAAAQHPAAARPIPAAEAERRLAGFELAADSLRQALRIPGLSWSVAVDGRIVASGASGLSDLERGTPATDRTLYPIGSITKTFTSTLMLGLADEGRLDLGREVRTLVDWRVDTGVTVAHVLSHTSEGTPGERFAYSSRFNWLDDVVVASAGEPFPTLLERRVLDAIGANGIIMESDALVPDSIPAFALRTASTTASSPARPTHRSASIRRRDSRRR